MLLVGALVRPEPEQLHRNPSDQDPAEVPQQAAAGRVHGVHPEPEQALGHAPKAQRQLVWRRPIFIVARYVATKGAERRGQRRAAKKGQPNVSR